MENMELISKYMSKCSFKNGKGRVSGLTYRGTAEDLFNDVAGRMIADNNNPALAFAYGHRDEIVSHLQSEMEKSGEMESEKKEKYFFTTDELKKWVSRNEDSWKISVDGAKIERVKTCGNLSIPVPSDFDSLATSIYTDLYNQKLFCGKDTISSILRDYLSNIRAERVARIADSITFNKDKVNNPELRVNKMLCSLYKFWHIKQDYDVFETAMKHWAWTVKRKLLGLEARNHLWISFQGAAKIGKTKFMERFTKPFEGFAPFTQMRTFLDTTKEVKLLTGNYILYIDELAVGNSENPNGERTLTTDEINSIKSMLTGSDISTRVYHSQDQASRRLTFSVISTSNTHLYDVLYDPTTMRRFLEFDCGVSNDISIPEFEQFSEATSDAIGFWQGIDENLEYGYLLEGSAVYKKIDKLQEEYYPTNKTTWVWAQWLANGGSMTGSGWMNTFSKGTEHRIDSLYENYKNFCKDSELCTCSKPNFTKFIEHFVKEYEPKRLCSIEQKSAAFDKWLETNARLKDIPPEWKHSDLPEKVEEKKENYLPF